MFVAPITPILVVAALIGRTTQPETVLAARRVEHTLILDQVYLNGQGPFRMMVDSGNESSLLRPEVARRLGLHPAYAVERITASGISKVPAAVLDQVRTGDTTDREVEALIAPVSWAGVDGVLGQSWLAHHDYLLDYRHHSLILDGAAPATGVRMALREGTALPVIGAEVDGRRCDMIVDSGASALVLFETSARDAASAGAGVLTSAGSARGEQSAVRLRLGDSFHRSVAAVRVESRELRAGLLPASEFSAVYVSTRRHVAVLVR